MPKTTLPAKLVQSENIKIDFNKAKNLSNYNNRIYRYCRETIEIKNNYKICNETA